MPGMDAPSMVQRSGDTLIIRSVVSGDQLYLDQNTGSLVKTSNPMIENYRLSAINLERGSDNTDEVDAQIDPKDEGLPQCKIKRNYSCNSCTFFTQNPRYFLTHLREIHGEKIVINECKLCLYASRHYQKLVRHMKMVHGSTEGIEEHGHARKRQLGREGRKRRTESPARLNSPVPQQLQQDQIISIAKPPIEESVVVATDEPLQNRLIKCSVCEFTTLYKDQLVDHEQDEHYKTKFFRCEKCSYVTHIKARYSKHVKYHSMPMIKCVTCDFRTPYKWNLDRHMKNHGGTGPFKCAACDFTADIKQSLTVHEMNHHVPPVGHAAGMGMARRRNKVGGTDINEDFISDNGDLSDSYNNNNNNDDFEEPPDKRCKLDPEDQPTDLSQKSNPDGAMAQKRVSRPVPNLIPIQAAQNALNLSKSFSVKDIASLFINEEKLHENSHHLQKINPLELSPNFNSSGSKKKNANIFDRLKEHLATDVGRNENLKCSCGYLSKCLSESIIHQKSCNQADLDEKHSIPSPINLSANTGSTRCQYCRHRCKSSADLSVHLQNCSEAANYHDSLDSMSDNNGRQESVQEENMDDQSSEMAGDSHPMENKVFVWNRTHDMPSNEHMDQDDEDKATGSGSKSESSQIGDKMQAKNENSYYGVETAPGYGEVTKKMTPEEEAANSSLKKVYKCPHCSFWASTASRFHVHIVGHLNKKPFECSLCAYRSNWRWDITKHIRLKTIRDPSHKNARVLMNDETGRRNYTKYNKYITLMKVTDEDGDPKLMKSGEMTPDQEASLSFLNEYTTIQKLKPKEENKISGNGNGNYQSSSSMDAPHLLPIPLLAEAMLGGVIPSAQDQNQSNSISPTLKSSEDLVTQNIDVKIDSTEKRTLYKCRKCNYKNSSREMVLVHVKGHYEEAGINLTQKRTNDVSASLQNAAHLNSNAYMKNMLAAMCLPKNQQISLNPATAFHPVSILPIQSQMINSKQLNSPIQHSPMALNNVILGNATAPPNEHGEMDEASSGVVTTTGTGVTGWRGPSPYRCGHCHQVSNWKHVIQRHCRLKHNGDIRIETINRNSDKNAPVYHPLVSQPGGSAGTGGTTTANSASVPSNNSNLNQQNTAQFNPKNTNNLDDFENSKKSIPENSTSYTPQTILQKQLTMTAQSSNLKSKKRQCPSCPFVSESKSQMTYHSSLHKIKPDIHQCHLCSFVSAKKHLLNQHVRTYHEKLENNENVLKAEFEAMDLRSKDSSDVLEAVCKTISFCAFCPARFIGHRDLKLHIKMHSALFPYRCEVCSYTARQEPYLLSHSVVHTNSYHEKSIDQCKKFRQDPEFLSPKLTQINSKDGEKVWIVSKNVPQTDLDDAIEKNIIQVEHDSQQAINEGDSSKNCSSTIELAKNSGISLLKQQLEAGEKAPNTDRTLVIGKSFDKCPQCPFETYNPINFKNHLSHHRSISGQENAYKCIHCDFSAASENVLKEHERIHFSLLNNGFKPVAYTSFNQLKLTLTDDNTTDGSDSMKLLYEDSDGDKESTHHPDDDVKSNESGNNANNDQKCKTIIDIGSGEVIGQCTNS